LKAVAILNSALEGQTSFSYSHRGAKRFGYNIGNSLIGVGLRAVAPDFEVVSGGQSLHSISNPAPLVDFLNRNFSRILVVLQDHVQFKEYGNPWALNDLEMKRLIKVLIGIQVPICFVSVTCRTDSLHNRTRKDLTDFSSELLEIFQRRDSVVLTRGRNSAEFLQTLGIENAHAASCPSIFVDVPAHGRAVRSHLVSTTGYLPIAPDFNEFYAHFVQGDGIEGPWRHLAARGVGSIVLHLYRDASSQL
jgi:hypothetical protein